jgi:hypothetical protein
MTDRLSVLNAAIECNNIGVALVQAGRINDALETFKWGAQLMYPVSQSFHTSLPWNFLNPIVNQIASSSAATAGMATVREAQTKIKREILFAVVSTGEQAREAKDGGFACLQPKVLYNAVENPCSCTYEAAVTLFNMGLAYFLQGSTASHLKALGLFEMSFSLAHMIPGDFRSSSVAMCSLNNAAYVHNCLANYHLSRNCLDMLSYFILGLPPAVDDTTEKERNEYLLNSVLLQKPTIASAA